MLFVRVKITSLVPREGKQAVKTKLGKQGIYSKQKAIHFYKILQPSTRSNMCRNIPLHRDKKKLSQRNQNVHREIKNKTQSRQRDMEQQQKEDCDQHD